MTPILFAPSATAFTTNGIGRLSDAISCTVHEARNGEFELEMVYPVDGKHYADIVHSAIIVAKPSARRTNQAFRIYKITKPMFGRVTISAQHISYQLSWIPVAPMTATNLTNALAYLKSGAVESCPFTFSADFTSDNDFAIPLPSSIRSYLGGRTGSILDIYGGEWEFDNYQVKLHRTRGEDNGYTIQYGKNLTTLTQEENIQNTYTGIYPYWGSEGTTVTLTEKVVYAPTAANFPFQRPLVMDFSDKFDGMPSEAQLRTYTQRYITANNIGIPSVNLKIDFVNLPDTEEYKDLLVGVENLDLCDQVTVIFAKLGISTKSKVVDIVWNVLTERYDSIQVGNARSTLSGTIEETITAVDSAATMSQVAQKIDRATGVLNAGTRGHVVLNRNVGGWANELLALDNDNIAAAQKVLRINMNGIGFSSAGYQGPYYQAWTMDGTLSLGGVNNSYGNLVILDTSGNVIGRWNKDGISASQGTFSGTITGSRILSSYFGTTSDNFYVVESGDDDTEVGISGFYFIDSLQRSNAIGSIENPASEDDSKAAISGTTGYAGFTKLWLLDSWYEGHDGSFWDVTRTLKWLDSRLSTIEGECWQHSCSCEGGDSCGSDDCDSCSCESSYEGPVESC